MKKSKKYGSPSVEKCTIMPLDRFEDFMDGVNIKQFMSEKHVYTPSHRKARRNSKGDLA
jgi:hypothetical protein